MFSCSLLRHIRCVQQVQQLANTITNCAPDVMTTFDLFAVPAGPHTGHLQTLTQSAAEVTKLVLQHSTSSVHWLDQEQEQDGTLTWVQQHVYGPCTSSLSLLQQVYSTSIEQVNPDFMLTLNDKALLDTSNTIVAAVLVREALVYILQHHVLSVSNCCAMLETACQASIKSLAANALRLVLSNFMQILRCHSSSFGLLSSDTLMMVLCCDSLQVDCEEDVCNAIQEWVLADPMERKPMFGDLFVQAVRLRQMTYNQARQIDDHVMVAQDRKACMAVARALLEMLIGAPTRQQPRKGPQQLNSDHHLPGQLLDSHWATPERNTHNSQSAVQSGHQSLHSMTQLSFAMHEGVRQVQRQQASDIATHRQLSPLQWRYDQNYRTKGLQAEHDTFNVDGSSPSQEVELSCSEEVEMNDADLQSCGVSKLRLGSSHSQTDWHAESASMSSLSSSPQHDESASIRDPSSKEEHAAVAGRCTDDANAQRATSAVKCMSSSRGHDAQAAEVCSQVSNVDLQHRLQDTRASMQQEAPSTSCHNPISLQQESSAAHATPAMQPDCSSHHVIGSCRDVYCREDNGLACDLTGAAPQLELPRSKSSNAKRLCASWGPLSVEVAVSPTQHVPLKRAKPDQVRKLKF